MKDTQELDAHPAAKPPAAPGPAAAAATSQAGKGSQAVAREGGKGETWWQLSPGTVSTLLPVSHHLQPPLAAPTSVAMASRGWGASVRI